MKKRKPQTPTMDEKITDLPRKNHIQKPQTPKNHKINQIRIQKWNKNSHFLPTSNDFDALNRKKRMKKRKP